MEKIRVILADDSREYMDLMKTGLEADGEIEVIAQAEDGAEGLALIRKETPDFVVCDILLKRIDGLEMIRQLKEENAGKTSFILLSAFAGSAAAKEERRKEERLEKEQQRMLKTIGQLMLERDFLQDCFRRSGIPIPELGDKKR